MQSIGDILNVIEPNWLLASYLNSSLQGGVNELFFWAKSRQMPTQFSENGNIPCIWEKIRQKATENWLFGDGVASFMPTGYSFESFLK